ncbi:MAG: O-antigen ligase family protein [Candidatus Magasanikbacteria bacterium]|nr:O-antigen ligase family protein [Candidatus Magasanikbacteria bacterium]
MRLNIDFLRPKNFPLSVDQCVGLALSVMTGFLLYSVAIDFNLPIYLFATVLTGWFIFYYPEVGLIVALLSTLWFERWFTLAPIVFGGTVYKLYPLDVILALVGLSILWHIYTGQMPRPSFKRFKLDTAILLFGAVCFFSYAASWFKPTDPALAFGTFKNYFLYAVVYLYSIILFNSSESWARLMRWLKIGGFGLLFFLLLGVLRGQGMWSEAQTLSTAGARLLAQSHAFYFLLFALWLGVAYLWPQNQWWRVSRKTLWWLLLLAVFGVVVSLQRHLWLTGTIILVTWFIFLESAERRRLLSIIGWALGAAALAGLIYMWILLLLFGRLPASVSKTANIIQQRASLSMMLNQGDTSANWRWAAWRGGLKLWAVHPIIGTGLGQKIYGYDKTYLFEVAARELHNNYLGILVQMGLLGAAATAYWFWRLLKLLYALWQKAAASSLAPFVLGWGSVVLVFMIVFSVSVYWDTNFLIIWWWLALAALRFAAVELKIESL